MLRLRYVFIAIGAVAIIAAIVFSQCWRQYLNQPLISMEKGLVYELPKGAGFNRIASDLNERSIWRYGRLIAWHFRLFEPELVLKAGEYRLEPGLSPRQIVAKFASGDVVDYSVTLVEGATVSQLLNTLHSAEALEKTLSDDLGLLLEALSLNHNVESLFKTDSPEGLFFPDTYHYVRGDTDASILRRAHDRLVDQLQKTWLEREENLPYTRPYEVLIMASLIEKETGAPEERADISGVFVRRLQKGMRLQTDPTVIYGLGLEYQGNLTRKHLKQDTPYNTYTRHGLPPTPIAAAGREALSAAVKPAKGSVLYFVAKGDGTHQFSNTLAEHEQAVREYQILRRRADYRSAPNGAATKR